MRPGTFREDLFYRINEISLNVPALREREGDIIVLANHFLRKYGKEFGRTFRRFSSRSVEAMLAYSWRGNVRELENRVKRAAVMAEGDIVRAADLDFVAAAGTASLNLQEARRAAERNVVDRALAQADGNISKAAALLGVSRPTLYNLIGRTSALSCSTRAICSRCGKRDERHEYSRSDIAAGARGWRLSAKPSAAADISRT